MADRNPQEGLVDFTPTGAGKPCSIYYKTYGDICSRKRPLVVLHGGPGLTHDYMLSTADLASPPFDIPVIFYDQLGCGKSTPMPEKLGDLSFWTEQLYLDELTAVLTQLGVQDNYDLLGHSWGGMLGSTHAARQPLGLKRLVLSGTPVSAAAWIHAYRKYREQMPAPHREQLEQPRDYDTPDTAEYNEALAAFYAKHVMTMEPHPDDYERSFEFLTKDPTVVLSTLGPSEFEFFGFLKTWTIANELDKIKVPTLLTNGVNEGADDVSMKLLQAGIEDVKWVKFSRSTHMPHWEEREKYMKVVSEFLNE